MPHRRRRVAESHEAPVSETQITIDGTREPFLTLGTPNAHWVAVRRHEDVMITIAGRRTASIFEYMETDRMAVHASMNDTMTAFKTCGHQLRPW